MSAVSDTKAGLWCMAYHGFVSYSTSLSRAEILAKAGLAYLAIVAFHVFIIFQSCGLLLRNLE